MYYGGAHYWARCRGKVKVTINAANTTVLWSGCPTDNSNCILRFTIMSETIYGRDWVLKYIT